MKVQYCSDLHLEFPENRKFLTKYPLDPVGDVLLLAGDIVSFRELENARAFIDYVSDHYSAVYWVPGNHEYYGSDISEKPDPLLENIRPNVHLVNNQVIDHDGVKLVFSTLWSRISPLLEWDIQRSISDWIYGHHHVNIPAFRIGRTTMLTNQLGYVQYHEHGSFRRGAVVEVDVKVAPPFF